MGFGFSLLFIFILVPLTIGLLVIWLISKKPIFGKMLRFLWLGIFGPIIIISTLSWFWSKTELDKEDYHGEYIINRNFFKGKQTDWQYNHYRFEITDNDSILFYVTDNEKILNTYRGTIRTTDPKNHHSDRLIIQMDKPIHHIMTSNPTTYRSAWDFYLVFNSSKFGNVFFKKGKWEIIE